jgi:hypothetical protein
LKSREVTTVATKEDILEQIVEEYLTHKGYFVRHNIKFRPRQDHPELQSAKDSNHSDIDVVGFHPGLAGPEKVCVVSCKSWQNGFNPAYWMKQLDGDGTKIVGGREAWKSFRELKVSRWSEAFISAIKDATGSDKFTYMIAVAHVVGDPAVWEEHEPFQEAIGGNPIRILTFESMIQEISIGISKTVAGTEIGRTLQMFKAAGFELKVAKRIQ